MLDELALCINNVDSAARTLAQKACVVSQRDVGLRLGLTYQFSLGALFTEYFLTSLGSLEFQNLLVYIKFVTCIESTTFHGMTSIESVIVQVSIYKF